MWCDACRLGWKMPLSACNQYAFAHATDIRYHFNMISNFILSPNLSRCHIVLKVSTSRCPFPRTHARFFLSVSLSLAASHFCSFTSTLLLHTCGSISPGYYIFDKKIHKFNFPFISTTKPKQKPFPLSFNCCMKLNLNCLPLLH